MRDSDVRQAMRDWLAAQYAHDPSSRFVEEMCIWNGSARIDMAVINGQLHGYEIKSERDTLARLEDQMSLYNLVFDKITLVAAERHLAKAEQALPDWWGLSSVVGDGDGRFAIKQVRPAQKNERVDKVQLAKLLWKPELLSILEEIGAAKGVRSKPVQQLCELVAERLDERELSAHVRRILKARQDWLGQPGRHEREMTTSAN